MLGAFGQREDHSIGNIMLMAARATEVDICAIATHGVFDFICRDTQFESFEGQQVSLFTPAPQTIITTHGLRYEPPQGHLTALWQGVSNECCGTEFTIHTDGVVVVYRLF